MKPNHLILSYRGTVRLRTSERISFEQNEVIEFAPGVRTHPARLDTILRRPSQLCGVRACAVVPRPLTVGLAGVAQNPLTSILGSLGQALYGSGSGRVPFQPAFWRGGTPQPTPSRRAVDRWIRLSLSLVLKLSKSGSGVWAPFPPKSGPESGNLVSQKHTKRP